SDRQPMAGADRTGHRDRLGSQRPTRLPRWTRKPEGRGWPLPRSMLATRLERLHRPMERTEDFAMKRLMCFLQVLGWTFLGSAIFNAIHHSREAIIITALCDTCILVGSAFAL